MEELASSIPTKSSLIQSQSRMTAKDIKTHRKVTYQLVEAEERSCLIRNLLAKGVGFREEEEFLKKERDKFKGGGIFDKKKETVKLAMGEKLNDNYKLIRKLGRQKTKLEKTIGKAVGRDSDTMKEILRKVALELSEGRSGRSSRRRSYF